MDILIWFVSHYLNYEQLHQTTDPDIKKSNMPGQSTWILWSSENQASKYQKHFNWTAVTIWNLTKESLVFVYNKIATKNREILAAILY